MHALLYSVSLTLQQATANPHLCWRHLDTPWQAWVSLLGVTAPISWVQVHTSFCLCPQRVRFPSPVYVLAALLWVSGDLLQGGLCHAQGCCTQSPWPCGRPLLTCTFPGDTQTQSCLSLCGGVCALVCTRFV